MKRISLKCKCGAVQGSVNNVSPKVGNHVVCYCVDCQAFGNHLSNGEAILDEWGGTAIYQTPPWHVRIDKGMEEVRCLRLTPKGLYRWYAGCCNTPIGNTISAKFPFIGLIHSFFDRDDQTESLLGPIRGYHKLESAIGDVPKEIQQFGMPKSATFKVVLRLFKWKVTGGNKPNPFFDQSGRSICKPRVLKQNQE